MGAHATGCDEAGRDGVESVWLDFRGYSCHGANVLHIVLWLQRELIFKTDKW